MNKDVTSDALKLASNILDSLLPGKDWEIVNIALNELEKFTLEGYSLIPLSFGYKFNNTPVFLEQHGVILAKTVGWWYKDITSIYSHYNRVKPQETMLDGNIDEVAIERGYIRNDETIEYFYNVPTEDIGPRKHGQMAVLVSRIALERFIGTFGNKKDNQSKKKFAYENGELQLIRQDGTPCTLDFSKAEEYRPVFESFFLLYRDGNKRLFSRDELLKKYKELTKKDISWREFIKQKSSIVGKMISPKPCLKNRIVWEHDNETDMYRFEILPLSDK